MFSHIRNGFTVGVLCVLFSSQLGLAETSIVPSDVRGVVLDATTDEPLSGASVVLVDTKMGASTDLEGRFTISNVPTGVYTVRASYLGYDTRESRLEAFGTGDVELTFELSPGAIRNEPVVVTATRTPRYLYDVPVRTEVITAEELRHHNPDNIAEAMRQIPGVQQEVSCSICNSTGISIQGMPSRYTQVLIDDMPMYSGIGSAYSFLTVPADAIDQIEVVKGGNSVLYGTDAIAGIVNLRTIRPLKYPRMSLDAELGDYGRQSMSGTASFQQNKLGLLVSAQFFRADPRDGDGDGITEFTGTKRSYVSGKITNDINEKTDLSLRMTGILEDRQGGSMSTHKSMIEVLHYDTLRDYSETILTRRSEASLQVNHEINPMWSVVGKAAYANHDQDSDYEGFIYVANQNMVYSELQVNYNYSPENIFTFGGAYRYEATDENVAVSEHTYRIGSAFLQYDYNRVRNFESILGVRVDNHNIFGTVYTPSVALKKDLSENLTARVAYGQGFRAPSTFIEMVDQGIGVQYKYNTKYLAKKGESSQSVNLSLDYRKGTTSFSLSPFYHRIDDLIAARNDQATQSFIIENLETTSYVYGLESTFGTAPWKNVYFDVSYIYQGLDMDEGVLNYAKPPHRFRWMLDIDHPAMGLSLVLDGEINSPMNLKQYWGVQYNYDGSEKISESPWYQVFNMEIAWKNQSGLRLAVGGKNITNFTIMGDGGPLQYAYDEDSGKWLLDDTKYIWGPVQGRVFYARLSLTLN